MFQGIYVIWLLVPLFFVYSSLRAAIRKSLKRPGREYPGEFLNQAVFTAIALGVAIGIDQTVFEDIITLVGFDLVNVNVARWLLYPAVLVLLAYLNGYLKPKNVKSRTAKA